MNNNLQLLKRILAAVTEKTTPEDLIKAFQDALFVILKIGYGTEEEIASLQKTYEEALALIKDDSKLQALKDKFESALKSIELKEGPPGPAGKDGKTPTQTELVDLIAPMIPDPIKGDKGERGDIGPIGPQGDDGEAIMGPQGIPGNDGSPDTPEQIAEKLNTTEESVDSSVIKGLDELKKKVNGISIRPISIGGRALLQLYVNGSKKGAIQYLNLIPGTGVTLTYAYASGRNDITISASGAAVSLLTATGTIDNSNVVFTFVSAPQIVVVNGASYVNGAGVTIVGTTATLDNAPGAGGNVYAIG